MKAGVLLSIFLICQACVFAQTRELDSLKKILQGDKRQDSITVGLLLNISNQYSRNDNAESEKYANEALALSTKLQWLPGIALSYRQLGLVEYYKSNNLKSLEYSHKALNIKKDSKDKLFEASVFNNIANIYADIQDYEKAILYYSKLKEAALEAKDVNYLIIADVNIASIDVEKRNLTNAITGFKNALEIAKNNGYKAYVPTILNNLARAYELNGQPDEALESFSEIISSGLDKESYTYALVTSNLGRLYIDKQNFKEAELYLKNSLEVSKKFGYKEWEVNTLELLSSLNEKINKPEEALQFYKRFVSKRDSIVNEENKSEIIKKDLQFENDKNQALAQAEINRQKTIKTASILGGGGLLLAAMGGLVLYKRKRDAVQQKREAQFASQVADTELKALRAQMNPHFIFNSLNSISDYISKNNIEQANNYLVKFAGLMRQTLENSEKKQVLLSEDLKLLRLYMEAEALRMQHSFSFTIKIDPEIDPENTLVPPLILQPFVENSIKHGMKGIENEGHIQININKENEMIVYQVDDNGIGFQEKVESKEKAEGKKSSLGFKITKDRIDIINKQKNTNGSVQIVNKEKGVMVEVKLPLELTY